MRNALYRGALWLGYRALILKWRLRRPTLRGACVALWHEERLLVIRNSYRRGETLPGGNLRRRESPRTAAQRELAEEVGIDVDAEELTFCCSVQTRGRYADGLTHVFEIEFEDEPNPTIDQREVVWAGFCPAEQLATRPLIAPVRLYLSKRAAAQEP